MKTQTTGRERVTRCAGLAGTLCMICLGCSGGPAAIPPVDVDIPQLTLQFMETYDNDKNGRLSREELASFAPAADWAQTLRKQDLSSNDLEQYLTRVFDRRIGLVSSTCVVTRKGQVLAGAEVRLVPIPLLNNVLPTGQGVTDAYGGVMLSAPREKLPAATQRIEGVMPPGLYLVEVTHPNIKIPEKYNTRTELGLELSSDTAYRGLTIDLKF
jgi:hypothetical protein